MKPLRRFFCAGCFWTEELHRYLVFACPDCGASGNISSTEVPK